MADNKNAKPGGGALQSNAIGPRQALEYIDELITQNRHNKEKGHKSFTLQLIGEHGIGKTSIIESYGLLVDLVRKNTNILKDKFKIDMKLSYKESWVRKPELIKAYHEAKFPPNELNKKGEVIKENKKNQEILAALFHEPVIATVTVRQSDIIVSEDISGLPSSESDLQALHTELLLAKEVADEELTTLLKDQAKDLLKSNHLERSKRNTTRFDFTEWEKKINDALAQPHIEHVILVLDDITRSANNNPGILNVLMPVFRDYIVGQRPLHNEVSIVLTSNPTVADDNETTYYASEFDAAQEDGLFTKNLKFEVSGWVDFCENNDTHPSVTLFGQEKAATVFKMISPRRLTQFGQSLFNKFGTGDMFKDDPDDNPELLKTIYFHLGGGSKDSTKYRSVASQYIAYLKDIETKAAKFVEEMKKSGWADKTKAMMKELVDSHSVMMMTVVMYKINELLLTTTVDNKFVEAAASMYTDDKIKIPISVRYSIENMFTKAVEMDHGNPSRDEKKIITRIYKHFKPVFQGVGSMRSQFEKDAQKTLDKLKSNN